MKRLYTAFVTTILATAAATAQTSFPDAKYRINNKQTAERVAARLGIKAFSTLTAGKAQKAKRLTPAQVEAQGLPTEIITEQPAGTLHDNYYRTGQGFVNMFGEIVNVPSDGNVGRIVVADDNQTVYIKNILNSYDTNAWVKATRGTGDTLEIKLPQYILKQEDAADEDAFDGYLFKMKTQKVTYEGEQYTTFVPDDDQTIKFVWRNDSLAFVNSQKDSKLLGLCYSDSTWTGFADYLSYFIPFSEQPTKPADATKAQDYALLYLDSGIEAGRVVKVVNEGSDIYVGGLCDNLPDAWVKGTIKGDSLHFDAHQYMGIDPKMDRYTFFEPLSLTQDDEYFDVYNIADGIDFSYDESEMTFYTDSIFAVNQGRYSVNTTTQFEEAQFSPWEDMAAAPMAATDLYYEPYDEEIGYGLLTFAPYEFTDNGDLLDPNKIYYNIYLDDNVMTFYPDEYTDMAQEMTDIPFKYTNEETIVDNAGMRVIKIFSEGFDRIGVQMVYTGAGEVNKSDIVYTSATGDDPDAIHNVTANGQPLSTTFTDLSGRRVAAPSRGIYVKTIRYANGAVKAVKTLVK